MADELALTLKNALIDFLSPLEEAARDPRVLGDWLATLGQTEAISGDPALLEIAQHAVSLGQLLNAFDPTALKSWAGVNAILAVGRNVSEIQSELRQFGQDPARSQVAAGLAEEIMALLLASYLRRRHPMAFRVGSILTLIEVRENSPLDPALVQGGITIRYPRILDRFKFGAIKGLISEPGEVLKAAYFPNQLASGSDAWTAATQLFPNLSFLADEVGIAWRTEYQSVPSADVSPAPPVTNADPEDSLPSTFEPYDGSQSPPPPLPDSFFASYFPSFRVAIAKSESTDTALELLASSVQHPGAIPGYILTPVGSFNLAETNGRWRLTLSAKGQIPAFVIRSTGIELASAELPVMGGSAKILLERLPPEGSSGPSFILGSTEGTRLELGSVSLEGDLLYDPARKAASLSLEAAQSSAVIAPGDGDSFLSSVLPADGLQAKFDLGLVWSSDHGLTFKGSAGLDATLPVGISIGGVFTVPTVHLGLQAKDAAVVGEVSASIGFSIGPVHALVDRIGITSDITFPQDGGNLGVVDLAFAFKPPSGIGLAVDCAGVTGGGYLSHDDAKQEYAGVLQLDFQSYKLTAFGLLATVLPTGSGYSLIAMVDAEFPPIELGLGFTLDGVGGLLGVHRMASVDALRAALTAHTLSNLLFPKNPIANASQLLTELDTLFPGALGRFIFGPIVRIEWGTPALLTLDLALVLELPAPVRLVLISELTVLLPTPDEKLVEIHMSALGTIDFGTCEGALDAVLHDSRLMKFVLHGSMALRVNWSGQKTSLLAVGGVHPKFQLPPGFPKLDRVGISMPSGHVAKLNLDSYLAVTSNTLQIGAHVDIFVGIDGFGISGYLTFDTLIQRHPFHFDGDISGGIALSVDGHDLMALRMTGSLTGPAPWNAAGSVSFDVLWWSVTKSFSETFGDTANTPPLDQVDVGQLLRAALSDARNFAALFAPDVPALVTLKAPVDVTTVVLAHPGASISVHQTVVPLGLTISQYGGSAPLGETRFDITSVSADGVAQVAPALAPLLDDFAPAQYLTLSDDDKLASPSFERLTAGVELDGTTIFGAPMTRTVAYDTFLVDTPDGLPREESGVPTPFPLGVLTGVLLDGSAGRSLFARAASRRYAGPRHLVMPAELDFVVATSDQLTASGVGASAGMSYRQARAALDTELALHPERSGELLVAARYEVAA